MKKIEWLHKILPYLLFVFIGYSLSELGILMVRDKMLPAQQATTQPRPQYRPPSPGKGSYSSIRSRNILSRDGTIPNPIQKLDDKTAKADAPPVPSSLPLTLQGTIAHSNPIKSIANIEIKSKNLVAPFKINQEIEGLATLLEIHREKIIIRNKNNDRKEYIEMKIFDNKIMFNAAKAAPSPSAEIKVEDNQFTLKRETLNKYLNDLSSVLQQAATAPRRNANGEVECFRFLAIQPGSVYTQLGFQNGDCIKSVNGEKVDSPAKAMELYQALKTSNSIKLGFERDGRDSESVYNIK